MVRLKNKDWMWAVMRKDWDGKDVLIAVCHTPQRADELMGEYDQMFIDKGVDVNESYFYVCQSIFYA